MNTSCPTAPLSAATTALPPTLTLAIVVLAAVLGFKRNMWLVAAALAGHGVFDFFHSRLITNPGLPVWWPGFCGSYDVVAGAGLAWMIWSGRTGAKA